MKNQSEPNIAKSKYSHKELITIILLILTLFSTGTAIYLYWQNQQLQSLLTQSTSSLITLNLPKKSPVINISSPIPSITTVTLPLIVDKSGFNPPEKPSSIKWSILPPNDKRFTNPDLIWRNEVNSKEGTITINGTGWIYTKTEKSPGLEQDNPLDQFRNELFIRNWEGSIPLFSVANYEFSIDDAVGVGTSEQTFYKIINNSVRLIRISESTPTRAFTESGDMNYPYTTEYKIFISDIYVLENLVNQIKP